MLSCPSCSFSNNEQARLCGYCGLYLKPIGDYVLQEQIGIGGFAEVYRAVNRYTGHSAAIKFLHRKLINDKEVEQRFLREVEILRDLHSPNIVQIYDFGILEDIGLYLVMEWIDGETLDAYTLRQPNQRLPQAEALHLFSQLLYGLSRIHDQRVVHRDLKPKNFMIVKDQSGQSVLKILDFGIAWVADRQALTERGMFVGSTYFMAPEQFRAQKDLFGPSTDLYVAGLLLGWMLTGKHIFTGTSIKNLAVQHCYNMPPMLSELCPDEHYRPGLEAVVTYSLQKEPHRRFQSAMEFLEALNNPQEFQRQFLQHDRSQTDLPGSSVLDAKQVAEPPAPSALGQIQAATPSPPAMGPGQATESLGSAVFDARLPDSYGLLDATTPSAPNLDSFHAPSPHTVPSSHQAAASAKPPVQVLQNKKSQPVRHLKEVRAQSSRIASELESSSLRQGGATSAQTNDSKENLHADILVKEKQELLAPEPANIDTNPPPGVQVPSSAPEGAPPNAGPSSPPVEAGEMRVLSDLIASWPTKLEQQPQIYRRPPKRETSQSLNEDSQHRAWFWVSLFFLSSTLGLVGYLFHQHHQASQTSNELAQKSAKENLPLRSIHDQSHKIKASSLSKAKRQTKAPPQQDQSSHTKKSTTNSKAGQNKTTNKPSRRSEKASSKVRKRFARR